MKALLYGALIALLCIACHKSIVQPDRYSYKGDKHHVQPSVKMFPNENSFILSGITDSVLSDTLTSNIQKILSDHDIAGITITMLIPDKGIWQYDAGYISKQSNVLVDSSSVFYWASVSKLVTSTIIHQLIAENKLDIDDTLSNWYPQFDQSEQITIKHLLNHTSGIFSFNSDSVFHFENRFHSPSELLDVALKHEHHLNPGEYWSYSNTGYLLLALAHHQGLVVDAHYSMPLGAGNIVSNSKETQTICAISVNQNIPVEAIGFNMMGKITEVARASGSFDTANRDTANGTT